MRGVVAIMTVMSVLFFVGCGKTEKVEKPAAKAAKTMEQGKMMYKEGQLVYYTCPMEAHAKVHSDKPGKCELCGMDLVPVKITSAENAEFYGCPMPEHSHVRSDKPGVCSECGMKLQPMHMEKSTMEKSTMEKSM